MDKVTRPDGKEVVFAYDPIGRRVSKTFEGKTTRFLWDGDKIIHEWVEDSSTDSSTTAESARSKALAWLFAQDAFTPLAKLTNDQAYSLTSDHLGTPSAMFNQKGEAVWQADFDMYGKLKIHEGGWTKEEDCPFRFPGQYEDKETGLFYNRFRYYMSREGMYTQRDPIGLAGGNPSVYGYVWNALKQVDTLGLSLVYGLHTPTPNEIVQKGVHFGTHAHYPNGNNVEVSIRPDHQGGIKYKPSHPGQVKTFNDKKAFNQGVDEVKGILNNTKGKQKVLHQLDLLKSTYPDKGMEWNMLQKNIEKLNYPS